LGIDDGSDTYEEIVVGDTVASPTILKLAENKDLLLNINVRTKVGTSKEDVQAAFQDLRRCTASVLQFGISPTPAWSAESRNF
jgi:hypothetical protein